MFRQVAFLSVIIFAGCQTPPQSKLTLHARERLAWPTSIDESIAYLVNMLDEKETRDLYASTQASLRRRQSKLLFYIRKRFGLDRGNAALLQATGRSDPDDAAFTILKEFWQRTRTAINDPANYTTRAPQPR